MKNKEERAGSTVFGNEVTDSALEFSLANFLTLSKVVVLSSLNSILRQLVSGVRHSHLDAGPHTCW